MTEPCPACEHSQPGPGVTLQCDVCGVVTLPIEAPTITAREARVLDCLSRGLTSRQAAAELCIDKRTVETHVRTMARRLALTSAHPTTELCVLYRGGRLRVEGGR